MERRNEKNYRVFDSDSGSDSETTELGSPESLDNMSGPNFADFARSLKYDKSNFKSDYQFYRPFTSTIGSRPANDLISLETPLPADAHALYGKSKFESARKDVTTMFLVDSKNRDKNSYPQPTHFTIKPPRVYKNIVSIQVTQIKLLSSFFYFRAAKSNLVLPVIERGREAINKYLGFPLTEAATIPEGTYNINDLLSQLQLQMNYTPLFYDYPNYFSDFVTAFTTNGDLSVNFNQPGDSYYDSLNDKYVTNPTMDQIVSYYWGNRFPGLTEYSLDQVKIAYYYPVIYELIIDTTNTTAYPFFNQYVPPELLEGGESVRSHILFNSSGLNDPVVLYLINNNLTVLDTYRLENTFRSYLVNRYQLAYDTNSLRVNIITITLNTSLINLFNLTATRSLAAALSDAGYTTASYSNVSNTLSRAKVVFTDMYNYIQSQMTTYFAIGFATYASQYFIDTHNEIFIQNGLDATGIRTGYTAQYLTSGSVPITSSIRSYSNSPGYWPKFNPTLTNGGLNGGGIDPSGINVTTSMIPYNINSSNFTFGAQVIDNSNYYIQTDKSSRSVNCLINVRPAKYTVFKFRSPARQTLQVETLPLPYYYRFSDYNKAGLYKGVLDPNNSNVPQKYFDLSYAFLYNTSGPYQNSLMDNSNYSSLSLTPIFGNTFMSSFVSSQTFILNVQSNYAQFEFVAPYPSSSVVSTGLIAYNTTLSFVCVNSNSVSTVWGDTVQAFLYHDRGAFMADLQITRNENSNHYIQSTVGTTSNSDVTFNISTFAGHRYYTIFRSGDLGFPNMLFNPVIYYPNISFTTVKTDYVNFDPTANPYNASNLTNYPFVTNYDTDFLRLPTASSLWGIDPTNSTFTNSVVVQGKPIGYDISGVSNDLTDYQGYITGQPGFIPNTTLRIDPLSAYTFQAISPFDSNATSYFQPGSKNRLLEPVTNQPYTFKGTSSSQIKIVHWYDGYSIPQQIQDGFTTSNAISSGMTSSLLDLVPGTTKPILEGYPTNSNGGVQLGQGINAIGFLPTDGLYEISSFTFKSVLYPTNNISTTSEDPNTQIKYVGVFTGSYLASKTIDISSALTVLTYSKSAVYNQSTLSNTPNFGVEYGTWYEYGYDPSFVVSSNVKISGYTQGSNELLSYDSMYYMVPFDSNGSNMTYSRLAGSVLPYPLSQAISTGPNYFGQVTKTTPGVDAQVDYVIPSTIGGANPAYGPQGIYAYTQSQYEQSQPITTTSFGFRAFGFLVNNINAMFNFDTSFSNSAGLISTGYVGLNTAFTEYSDNLYIVNSLSNSTNISNAPVTFTGAAYASSLSSVISVYGGTTDCMHYLVNPPATVQNYSFDILSNYYSSFTYQDTSDADNIITRSYEFDTTVPFATIWLWGAGGGANAGVGGAGAYAKVKIDIQKLLDLTPTYAPQGISTVYVVVGRGGDKSGETTATRISGQDQGYEQLKYGGGGTSFYDDPDAMLGTSNYFQTRGGGFTGIFINSNLTDPLNQPLIIVGGGGGGGNALSNLGGPGGFGKPINTIADTLYFFSSASLNLTFSDKIYFSTIQDIDSNPLSDPSGPVTNAIDSNYTTTWNPTATPFMNPGNYNPTVNTYRVNMNFGSNVTNMDKLRFYLETQGDTANIPTGYVVYNNSNKTQIIYSNANAQTSNLQLINNGTFTQYIYDLTPLSSIRATTINTDAWIAVGVAPQFPQDMIQYSADGSNWARVTSIGPSFPTNTAYSVIYVPSFGKWYAGGSGPGTDYGTAVGATWAAVVTSTSSNIPYYVAVSDLGKYQIYTLGGLFISSDYGQTWSPTSITTGAGQCAISATGQYTMLIVNNVLFISSNYASTFTSTGLSFPSPSISVVVSASGQYMVVCEFNTKNLYLSSNYGQTWTLALSNVVNLGGISMSASGQYILIVGGFSGYLSSNYGVTWSSTLAVPNIGGLILYASAVSATGQYMILGGFNTSVFISTNYGVTWTAIPSLPSIQWRCASISSSGRYIVIAPTGNGNIFISRDYGVTWVQNTALATGSWFEISISGSGKYMLASNLKNPISIILSTGIYRSVAADPTPTTSPIMESTDGLNWTPCLVTEYNGVIQTFSFGNGVLTAGVYQPSGPLLLSPIITSIDGYTWTLAGVSGVQPGNGGNYAQAIRYLNSVFWAPGTYNDGSCLKKSIDGFTWTTVPLAGSSITNITFGLGRYVVSQYNLYPPYNIGLLWSGDGGITWNSAVNTNLNTFSGISVAFGNNTFVACGSTTDGSTNIKYSINGINWSNSTYVNTGSSGDTKREVKFVNGRFICIGSSAAGTGRAANQTSILTSADGISWIPTLSGGFSSDINAGSYGWSVDYGPISIPPNLSSIYIEIQKSTPLQPLIYEIQGLKAPQPIDPHGPYNGISSMIDNNTTTVFWPTDSQTVGILSYPITLNFSSPVSSINKLQFYAPSQLSTVFFTGITVQSNASTGTVYQDSSVTPFEFLNGIGYSYYQTYVIPAITNVSTLFINFNKATASSIQIIEARALFDTNANITQIVPNGITDLDNRGGALSNAIDGNLSTVWTPNNFVAPSRLRLNLTFSNIIDNINRIQIYSGASNDTSRLINGIYIYADSNKLNILYSNDNPSYNTYLNYNRFDISFGPLIGSSNIYVELSKNTGLAPTINEISFYSLTDTTTIFSGYTGGTITTMKKSIVPTYQFDGGGGTNIEGGIGGAATASVGSSLDPSYIVARQLSYQAQFPTLFPEAVYNLMQIGAAYVIPDIADNLSAQIYSDFVSGCPIPTIPGVSIPPFPTRADTNPANVTLLLNNLSNSYVQTLDPYYLTLINSINALDFSTLSTSVRNINIYGNISYSNEVTIFNSLTQYQNNYTHVGSNNQGTQRNPQGINYTNIITLSNDLYGIYGLSNLSTNVLPSLTTLTPTINIYNNTGTSINNVLQNIPASNLYGITFISYPIFFDNASIFADRSLYMTRDINNVVTKINVALNPFLSDPPNLFTAGLVGAYLTGGSPGVATIYPDYGINANIGGGGGGGGYYGGGGASRDGGGGGGAGYIYDETILNIIEYGVALPASNGLATNYVTPGNYEQFILLSNSIVPASDRLPFYGQGGFGAQSGSHGLVVFAFSKPTTINPLNNETANPNYLDGSKMAVFQAPIIYNTDVRELNFSNYSDSIETTQYAGYNWVWYRSYLSLVGQTLETTMTPSGYVPTQPMVEFPNLPGVVYETLAYQFNNVVSWYSGTNPSTNISTITDSMGLALNLFQPYFTQIPYTDSKYIEMTEIYGLLDYLQNYNNLARPHLDPRNPQLNRVFGGVPRFGYWANPFLTNASYVGFDIAPSQFPTSALSNIVGTSGQVTAMYGLVLEQSLSSGKYEVKDIMAYKPTLADSIITGSSNWLIATQFPETYVVRSLTSQDVTSNIPVQPYTMKSAIQGQLPLFNYKVYTTPYILPTNSTINVPIHMINDFQGAETFFYTFQNVRTDDVSSISLTTKPFTSTLIHINQTRVTSFSNLASNVGGTVLSEYPASTYTQVVSQFGFNSITATNFTPVFNFTAGTNNFYNTYADSSPLQPSTLGKGISDYTGNFYATDNKGGIDLYENICTFKIYQQAFSKTSFNYASPSFVLSEYLGGSSSPFYDYLVSKFTNVWHVQGTQNLSTIYGARLTSPFDYNLTTNFVNQIFYPTHKIILTKKGSSVNPMIDAFDLSNYPSYSRTDMFYYTNFSSMSNDIYGKFALENTSNFAYNDMTSGYFFDSYIHNINMTKSSDYNNSHPDSFNYLAIRSYSPSETFQALVRFYLPGRYDFGYISLQDLSNEIVTVQTDSNVNPDYLTTLGLYTSSFAVNRIFGGTGLPGFSGSNISSVTFGDFLNQYIGIYSTISSTAVAVSTINGRTLAGTSNLITGDLRYILPSYVAGRERVTDPIEFSLPLSTVVADSNRNIDEYGLGYNLGYKQADTKFDTVQRADSFFKILDDYIYMKMNEEYDMNRLDITTKENLAITQDSTAQPNLYNCKLLLNNFGTYATTFVQNPVYFNPAIGKLDKLTFSWYDITGQIIDNSECEWSAAVQIVERLDVASPDSTAIVPAK